MIAPATLGLFGLAVLALLVSPGPNMAFVLSHGVAHGPRGGLAASLGIAAADLVHTLCAATGVTALIAASAPAFEVLRHVGALFLLWLAWQALRARGSLADPTAPSSGFARIVWRAWLQNLVNPKALIFFMVFLPQFVDPVNGPIAPQLVLLGVLLSLVGLLFHAVLGACGGQVGRWMQGRRGAARLPQRLLATMMAGLALRLLLLDRPVR